MPDADALRTFAELGIALAGFSGIVAVLGRRSQGEWSALEWARLSALLATSLGATLFAVLPELVRGAAHPMGWLRVGHGLLVAYQLAAITYYFSRANPSEHQQPADRVVAVSLTSVGFVLLLAQTAVALGLLETGAARLYVGALVYLLVVGATNFVLLLLGTSAREG